MALRKATNTRLEPRAGGFPFEGHDKQRGPLTHVVGHRLASPLIISCDISTMPASGALWPTRIRGCRIPASRPATTLGTATASNPNTQRHVRRAAPPAARHQVRREPRQVCPGLVRSERKERQLALLGSLQRLNPVLATDTCPVPHVQEPRIVP